jgi:hypothetical protein
MTHLNAVRAMLLFVPAIAAGQMAGPDVRVSPASVTVNSQGPTTAILTYSGVGGYAPAEGTWCATLAPVLDRGVRCDPATIYGQSPRPTRPVSAAGTFTDVMSVSASKRPSRAGHRASTSCAVLKHRQRPRRRGWINTSSSRCCSAAAAPTHRLR